MATDAKIYNLGFIWVTAMMKIRLLSKPRPRLFVEAWNQLLPGIIPVMI